MSTDIALTLFAGAGVVRAVMREKDWSHTPLGPVAGWPQSLRTAASVMLASPQPCYVFWGPELAILYNDGGLPFVGTKHPDCLGLTIREVLKEAWPVLGPLVEGVMRDGTAVYLENLLIPLERVGFLQDGYFTFSYIPIRSESNDVGGILVNVNETTSQVLGARRMGLLRELSLRSAQSVTIRQLLAATEEALRQVPDDLPFALLYELHNDGPALVVNVGLDPGYAGAWPLGEAVAVEGEVVLTDLARFGISTGTVATMRPLVADGDSRVSHVLVTGHNPRYPLDDDARNFLHLLARQIASSLASTRALEEKAIRAAELAELDRQKTEFFSSVSHEFRTPLTLMLGPLEEAMVGAVLGGNALAAVHRNALRLLKLVNNLLDFSRVEAGRAQAVYRPVNLAELTTDLASGFRSAIEGAGIAFEIVCEPTEPVFVDVEMWEKIVLNLVSNAFKFTFSGKITVRLQATAEHAVLSVTDSGVGIADDSLPRLFERFYRVRGTRSRTHEGSGIGLALVSDLARLHGGRVDVQSRIGAGSTFTVTIPRGSAALATDAEPQAVSTQVATYVEEALGWLPKAPTTPSNDTAAARVLIADDNGDMRDYLTRILSKRWQVETAADGELALAQALANPPDAIVSDMMMPGFDGLELVRRLRSDERTREVPFLLLSARADQQATMDALGQGASDYMIKPFSSRELVARVAAQMQIAAVAKAGRERIESFLMQAPAALAVVRGPSLTYVLANAHYQQIVGRTDLIGKPMREALPELVAQGTIDLIEGVFVSGTPFQADLISLELARGKGGALERGYFSWVAQPTYAVDGKIDGVLLFAVEITEQVRARQEVERATLAAETANRTKDEFLAMLGHELRNPLAPISTALQLMRLRGSEAHLRERGVIERQVAHLEGLVNDLLDVSRITQGKVELKRTRVEMADIVAEAVEMASALLEQRRHRLDVLVAPSGLVVDGDVGRLKQIFANLVSNAAKYTEKGGRISIEATAKGDIVVVEVRDNGLGISAEMLPRLFDLFSQAPQSLERSQGGLGLGLSIVRSLVEMHGGRVSATSRGAGKGSSFVVELPRVSGTASIRRDSSTEIRALKMPQAGSRILVVDDNQDAAELLAEMLSGMGHTTSIAHDGPHALRVAADFRPTVALLDIGLPVMDGYELARRMRADLPSVKLVAITGYGQLEDRRRTTEAGFDAHLVKPVDFGQLVEVVKPKG